MSFLSSRESERFSEVQFSACPLPSNRSCSSKVTAICPFFPPPRACWLSALWWCLVSNCWLHVLRCQRLKFTCTSTPNPSTSADRDGEVDWDTLGNILCSKLMGEVSSPPTYALQGSRLLSVALSCTFQVLLASYLDTKHCQMTVDFAVDTDWEWVLACLHIVPQPHTFMCTNIHFHVHMCRYAYEEKDVVVLRKQNPVNPSYVWYVIYVQIILPWIHLFSSWLWVTHILIPPCAVIWAEEW